MKKDGKRNIRAEILATARKMFGEDGYNAVSMRNIADALGISVGNLTYHYKKKEDLIEAVFMAQNVDYKRFQMPRSLAELHEAFVLSIWQQQDSAYYFRHYTQLAQSCPNVHEIQRQAKEEKIEAYVGAFKLFQKEGYIKAEGTRDQYKSLAYALTMMNIYWMLDTENPVTPIRSMWNLVYPSLTKKGIEVFRNTIEPEL